MPGTNLLYSYWKTEERNFGSLLDTLKQDTEKEAVHAFRVSVKKLHAYLHLYYLLADEDPGKDQLLKNIHGLFEILGYQRNIEICLDLLDLPIKTEAALFPAFQAFLKERLDKCKASSTAAILHFKEHETAKIARLLREEAIPVEPFIIYELTRKFIHTIATGKKHLHQARLRLKEIYYWITQLPKDDARTMELENRIGKNLDKLGSWQDAEVFIRYAKHFRKDVLPQVTKEYAELKAKEKMLQKGKNVIAQSAWRRIQKLDDSMD